MRLESLAVCFFAGMALHAQGAEKFDLPNVLIIGDSISIGYTKPLVKILKGKDTLQKQLANKIIHPTRNRCAIFRR